MVDVNSLGSRFLGQCFDPTGHFLSPITSNFKILFHLLCQNCKDWDIPEEDIELVTQFKDYLRTLQTTIGGLLAWPRCVRPRGFLFLGMDGASDG